MANKVLIMTNYEFMAYTSVLEKKLQIMVTPRRDRLMHTVLCMEDTQLLL